MPIEHNIDFSKASFKDFEVISNLNAFERAGVFRDITDYMKEHGQMNYRFVTSGGCGPEIWVQSSFNEKPQRCVSLVSNDYDINGQIREIGDLGDNLLLLYKTIQSFNNKNAH